MTTVSTLLIARYLLGKRPSLYIPASFIPLLDKFVLDISLIEASEF